MISSVSSNAADEYNIVISGSSFGTNPLSIEWLGGLNGNIEQGTVGTAFSKGNWTKDPTSDSRQTPIYTNEKSHSGAKSIKSYWPVQSQYTSAFTYDTGKNIGTLYMTFWVYFEHVDSAGQWKIFRIRPDSNYGDRDGEYYFNEWYNSDHTISQGGHSLFCKYDGYAQCYPNSDDSLRWPASYVNNNKWIRLEVYGKESSGDNVRDADFDFKKHDQTSAPISLLTNGPWIGNIKTRVDAGEDRWRYIVFENYWGNISAGSGTGEKAYFDDIYIQVGTKARVEIGNNPIFTSCTHREIQFPTAWSDSSIAITFNKGSFVENDTVYLFVADANGNVNSQGYPVTIQKAVAPPSPPKGLRITN